MNSSFLHPINSPFVHKHISLASGFMMLLMLPLFLLRRGSSMHGGIPTVAPTPTCFPRNSTQDRLLNYSADLKPAHRESSIRDAVANSVAISKDILVLVHEERQIFLVKTATLLTKFGNEGDRIAVM